MIKSRFPSRASWVVPLLFAGALAVVWAFPAFWYTKHGAEQRVWFREREELSGWKFDPSPISKSAERLLVADRTVNGEFTRDDEVVRVFSAKRYIEKSNEIGLFVHTPDRCWVETGWKIEDSAPDVLEITVHGTRLLLERRLFNFGGHRELVYFCGLVGGQTLPYRLDHNLSMAKRSTIGGNSRTAAARTYTSDSHFWGRLWNSFSSRRELTGAKHFIRISTPVFGNNLTNADETLHKFLEQWLTPGDYNQELATWKTVASR